jgi:hypothetical protein
MSIPLLPFLYQTRTILRCRRHLPVRGTLSRAFLHLTAAVARRRKADDDIPFVQGVSGTDVPAQEDVPRGTITAAERQTFEHIFADIRQRGLTPNVEQDLPPPSLSARRSANRIIEQAAFDSVQTRPSAILSPTMAADAARDKQKALERFPPSLRAAASRAFELIHPDHPAVMLPRSDSTEDFGGEGESEWQATTNSALRAAELEAKRLPEQKRVEDLMAGARSDFELWDIMEKEVFTYPDRLSLRRQSSQEPQTQSDEQPDLWLGGKKVKAKFTVSEPIEEEASEDNTVAATQRMNLYIYGPLYPSFLLFGLRRLDQAFAMPSQLALSVLPRIKELGLESFVVGVSTPFYNELLDIYQRRYGNLDKMLELLEEMRHSGLHFDEGTVSVLQAAHSESTALSAGKHGVFAQAFMTMPEYERALRDRLKNWLIAVKASVKQQDAEMN